MQLNRNVLCLNIRQTPEIGVQKLSAMIPIFTRRRDGFNIIPLRSRFLSILEPLKKEIPARVNAAGIPYLVFIWSFIAGSVGKQTPENKRTAEPQKWGQEPIAKWPEGCCALSVPDPWYVAIADRAPVVCSQVQIGVVDEATSPVVP